MQRLKEVLLIVWSLYPSTFDVEWSFTICLDMRFTVIQFNISIPVHSLTITKTTTLYITFNPTHMRRNQPRGYTAEIHF